MATIRKELTLNASPAQVWDVIRDVGAVHAARVDLGRVARYGRGGHWRDDRAGLAGYSGNALITRGPLPA